MPTIRPSGWRWLPSPLRGGVGGGGNRIDIGARVFTPPLNPSPSRGGESVRASLTVRPLPVPRSVGGTCLLDAIAWTANDVIERSGSLQEFVYERPETIDDAVVAMAAGDARALAGGTDLIPQLREGRRQAGRIVDLKRIPELTAIVARPDGGVSIGAAATASAVARHAGVAAAYPAVAQSARLIGGVQIQNRASLGGNICNAAPSADAVPALVCHEARALIAGRNGRREVAVETLFQGPGRTKLEPGEVLVSILLPPPQPRSAAKYLRFTPRREMDIAVAGAGVWISLDGD